MGRRRIRHRRLWQAKYHSIDLGLAVCVVLGCWRWLLVRNRLRDRFGDTSRLMDEVVRRGLCIHMLCMDALADACVLFVPAGRHFAHVLHELSNVQEGIFPVFWFVRFPYGFENIAAVEDNARELASGNSGFHAVLAIDDITNGAAEQSELISGKMVGEFRGVKVCFAQVNGTDCIQAKNYADSV